jgi:hypothetical protein
MRRDDTRGQVIIEFVAFMTAMMAGLAAMMDDMVDLIRGLFGG